MLSIQLLGGFKITDDGESLPGLTRPRGKSLLAYLLLHHATPQDRAHLAYTFWPETSDSQARTNLRRELHQLRQSFPRFDAFVQSDGQSVQWQMPANGVLDVAEFTHLLAAATQATDHAIRKAGYQAAIDLYHGDLLPGLYEDWVLTKREALRQAFIQALEMLTRTLVSDRDYAAATRLSQHLLQYDPLYEAGYLQLMELYALQDDRARALHTYHSCVTVLERELGVPPGAELEAIYQRLLHADQRNAGERTVSAPTTLQLVGRKAEWQTLLATWQRVGQGRAHMLLIEGEAGIGKTRLAEELLEWANRQAIPTARTRSYAAEGSLAYAPVIEWLRSPALSVYIAALEPVWRTEVARLLPELLTDFSGLPAPEALTERWQRQRLFEALARAMTVDEQSKLLLIDDLQWCDQETLEWLRFLLRFAPAAPLLVLGTVRVEEVEIAVDHPLHSLTRELSANEQLTVTALSALSPLETNELALQVSDQPLNDAISTQLFATSEGNPLFIVEMVRGGITPVPTATPQLTTPQSATPQPTTPQSTTPQSLVANSLPPKVYAVIQHRLAQLSPVARALAALAATIGRSFTFDVLAAASDKGESEVVNGLDELWQRHVIHEQGASAYDFSHDRIREAAYAELSPMRRKQLHRQVAQALETIYKNDLDAVSGQLALHYERTGLFVKAIDWYVRAAHVAWNLHAFHDTVNLRRSAMKLISHLPITAASKGHALTLQIEFSKALAATTGFTKPEYRQTLLEAGTFARELHDIDLLADVLSRLMSVYITIGDTKGAQHCADEAHSILELAEEATSKAYIYGLLAGIARHRGDFGETKRMYENRLQYLRSAYKTTGERSIQKEIGGTTINLATILWITGFAQQAWQLIQTYLTQRGQIQEPFQETNLMFQASIPLRNLGDDAMLAIEATQMLQLGTQYEIALSRQSGAVFSGWLLAKQGQLLEGIALTNQGIDGFRRMGHSMFQTHRLAMLVEMLLWAEEYAQAHRVLQEALEISVRCAEHFWDVELYRLQGDLLLAQGEPDEQAEAAYLRAIEIAQQQGAKSLELRATTALCRLWQRQGQSDQAHQVLSAIYGWFTEGFDTQDLRAARALLAELLT